MSEIRLGTYQNPYTKSKYMEMEENETWSGGWVNEYKADYSIPTYVTYYISSDGTSYLHTENQEPYGTQDNAFPEDVYEEMCQKDLWPGGYVDIEDDGLLPVYREPDDGTQSACGCGCGSGSGSESGGDSGDGGSGSGCGGGIVAIIGGTKHCVCRWFDVEVSWGDGVLNGSPLYIPNLSIDAVHNNYEQAVSLVGCSASWESTSLKIVIQYKEPPHKGGTKSIDILYSVTEYLIYQ